MGRYHSEGTLFRVRPSGGLPYVPLTLIVSLFMCGQSSVKADVMLIEESNVQVEAHVLSVSMDILVETGGVSMHQLRKRLKWSGRKYAELRRLYDKWDMAHWEMGV